MPGHPPFFDQSQRHATREKYAVIGMHLPVDVSPDLRKATVQWKEVPTVDDFIASGAATFTDPGALHAEVQTAWTEVAAHHGGVAPQRMARAPIDGPSARVMALGHGANSYDTVLGKWEMLLSVAEPGRPRYGYRWQGKIPYKTLVLQGQDLPVEVTPKGVEIPWDRIREDVKRRRTALDPTGQLGKGPGIAATMGTNLKMLRDAGRKLQAAAANPELLSYRARISNIMATGVEMPATITAATVGEWQPALNGIMTHLSLTVEPQNQPAYQASFDQPLPQNVAPTLAVGQRVTVRVARDDAQAVMLWNTPHAAGGADPSTGRPVDSPPAAPAQAQSPANDRLTMLERLSELRATGALSDAEFDVAKARLLGD
ncbi:MAG TPA: SHOCT domain-containing protein [Solirubrobacteraceae bacterium]